MFFSVIVPIYKVEKYLNQCVESIIRQTFLDFELILVDDGSPDGCPEICDEYARKDARIQVIHKENGGLSDARNAGLALSTGEYVIFIDSDDYWDDNEALEKIQKIILEKTPDVVTWRWKKYFEETARVETVGYAVQEVKDIVWQEMIKSRNFTVSACAKAIKKELFDTYSLYFEKGVYSEDIEWCARLLAVATNIVPSNLDFYVYRQRGGSISHAVGRENIEHLKAHLLAIEKMVLESFDEKKEKLQRMLAEEFCNFVVTIARCKNRKENFTWIKKKKSLLKWATTKRCKMLRLMLSFLGVKLTVNLIGLIS